MTTTNKKIKIEIELDTTVRVMGDPKPATITNTGVVRVEVNVKQEENLNVQNVVNIGEGPIANHDVANGVVALPGPGPSPSKKNQDKGPTMDEIKAMITKYPDVAIRRSETVQNFNNFISKPTDVLIGLPTYTMEYKWLVFLKPLLDYFVEQRSKEGNEKIKLIITVLSHEDISFVVNLLKATFGIWHNFLAVPLASRERGLCINPDIQNDQTRQCNRMRNHQTDTSSCKYYRGKERHCEPLLNMLRSLNNQNDVMDIESLAAAGRACGVCPYFGGRELAHIADIVVTPYNYVLNSDAGTRDFYEKIFEDAIIYFDRAESGLRMWSSSLDLQDLIMDLKTLNPRRLLLTTDAKAIGNSTKKCLVKNLGFETSFPLLEKLIRESIDD